MSTPARFLPWGDEPLVPHVRVAAYLAGASARVLTGRALDLGEGSHWRVRCAGPDALAWSPADTPGVSTGWTHLTHGAQHDLVVAWPGPGAYPQPERAAWWAACADTLREGGVIAVRLDLRPGWHALTAIRDFARFHGGRTGQSLEDALQDVLSLGQAALPPDEGRWYGWLHLTRTLLKQDPWTLADLTGETVHAIQLHEWAREAAAHGLTWIGDARGPNTLHGGAGHAVDAWVRAEVTRTGDALRGAQILDYARNQHTRLALFIRGDAPAPRHDLPADTLVGGADDRPHRWAFETAVSRDASASPEQVALTRALASSAEPWWTPGALAHACPEIPETRWPACLVDGWRAGYLSLRIGSPTVLGSPPQRPMPDGITQDPSGRCRTSS